MIKNLLFFVLLASCSLTLCAADDRPNIVLIMADDLGSGDVSYFQERFLNKKAIVKTPAIDALAKEGLWFTDAHSATSLCSPTRYCVMSGNANYRSYAPWGVWGASRPSPFKRGEATLGSVAKTAGYQTGFIGKWHLGGDFRDKVTGRVFRGNTRGARNLTADMTKIIGGGPSSIGFDYSLTMPCGIQGPPYAIYENDEWMPFNSDSKMIYLDEDTALDPKFVSDKGPGIGDSNWDASETGKMISAKAVEFIDRSATSETPFFLCYWSPQVHLPHCPTDEFDGVKVKGTTPSRHLDTLVDFDLQVARIVKALKANDVYKNTLILFTSDNGGLGNGQNRKAGHFSSGEYRGHKNSPFEGGHRVPLIAVWNGKIKPNSTSDALVVNQDVLATMAKLLNVSVPKDQAMDSLNLLPLLNGEGEFQPREYLLMQAGSQQQLMFRKDGWKLILQSNHKLSKFEPTGLFYLNDNPAEKEELNKVKDSAETSRVQEMKAEYLRIRESGIRTTPELE